MLGKTKTTPQKAFGLVLRRIRLKAGFSQEALALEAGLQRNYISLMELGRNQPTITTLFKLSAALEISPSDIVKEVERGSSRPPE
jgi:transcriptional regulator with XRE-family HTH domain